MKRSHGRPRKMGRHIEIDLREVGYDGETCLEPAWDHFQWQACVLVALNLRILLAKYACRRPSLVVLGKLKQKFSFSEHSLLFLEHMWILWQISLDKVDCSLYLCLACWSWIKWEVCTGLETGDIQMCAKETLNTGLPKIKFMQLFIIILLIDNLTNCFKFVTNKLQLSE